MAVPPPALRRPPSIWRGRRPPAFRAASSRRPRRLQRNGLQASAKGSSGCHSPSPPPRQPKQTANSLAAVNDGRARNVYGTTVCGVCAPEPDQDACEPRLGEHGLEAEVVSVPGRRARPNSAARRQGQPASCLCDAWSHAHCPRWPLCRAQRSPRPRQQHGQTNTHSKRCRLLTADNGVRTAHGGAWRTRWPGY